MAPRSSPSGAWKSRTAMLLLQLATAAVALVHPRLDLHPVDPAVAAVIKSSRDDQLGPNSDVSKSLLSARQDGGGDSGTPMGVDCLYLCTLATCGGSGASCPLKRRSSPRYSGIEATESLSAQRGNDTHAFGKRVFNTDHRPWTVKQVDDYLVKNKGYRLNGGVDTQFPDLPHLLINPFAEVTVAKEIKMGPDVQPFQIGTDTVHGCTVVTIVSERAVWMAHFWEVSAMGGLANAGSSLVKGTQAYTNFQERVINPITGEGSISGIVDKLTPDLYTKSTDQTRAIIFTPLRSDWDPLIHDVGEVSWQYRPRINEIVSAIQRALGKGVSIEVNPYVRLNYRTLTEWVNGIPVDHFEGPDRDVVSNRPARGTAWFQYDGSYKGQYWRLFLEYLFYRRGDYQKDIGPDTPGPKQD